MTGPRLASLHRFAVGRLRTALWRVAGILVMAAAATTAIGLAMAAGVLATAERVGVVEALLVWSAGLLLAVLAAALTAMLVRRFRRPAAPADTPTASDPVATALSDIGLQTGLRAGRSLSPLGKAATAFVVGILIARSVQR